LPKNRFFVSKTTLCTQKIHSYSILFSHHADSCEMRPMLRGRSTCFITEPAKTSEILRFFARFEQIPLRAVQAKTAPTAPLATSSAVKLRR
jgi:hypothetical protein